MKCFVGRGFSTHLKIDSFLLVLMLASKLARNMSNQILTAGVVARQLPTHPATTNCQCPELYMLERIGAVVLECTKHRLQSQRFANH